NALTGAVPPPPSGAADLPGRPRTATPCSITPRSSALATARPEIEPRCAAERRDLELNSRSEIARLAEGIDSTSVLWFLLMRGPRGGHAWQSARAAAASGSSSRFR